MSSKSIITHVTPVGGNIFADLGFEPDEAARLLAETDAVISEKLAIENSLMTELTQPAAKAAGYWPLETAKDLLAAKV